MAAEGEGRYRAAALGARVRGSEAEMLGEARGFRDRMASRRSIRTFDSAPVPRAVIEACVAAAGGAPSGANQQPWHFVAVSDPELKSQIREAAEEEERRFYDGGAPEEWLDALAPIGTDWEKPHLTEAPWLIVIFAERWGRHADGARRKNYYVPESVGIATGFLIAALHHAGLVTLTHTPNPMKFLGELLGRPEAEKATMILVVGHPAEGATVPEAAKVKKALEDILTVRE